MNVSYENNLEDVVALTEHQLSNNVAYNRRRRWNLYGSPLFLLAAFSFLGYSIHLPSAYAGGVAAALASFLWSFRFYWNFPRKAVEKLQREKPQKEIFCRHTIGISPDGFSEETAESRHFQTWNALVDIAFTPDYIFVYNTSATAHVIPRRELGDAQFQQIGDEIRKYRNA